MSGIDLRTINFMTGLMCVVMGIVILGMRHNFPSAIKGMGLWGLGVWLYRPDIFALAALLPVAGHLMWQVATLDAADPANPPGRFRSNRWAGALMAAACFVVGNAGA